jgi:dolichyl-phosphate beta-glucosyltransferase
LSRTRLEVVIPAFDEEARLGPTLARIHAYLSGQDYSWRLTVVSDGSRDSTPKLVQEFAAGRPEVRLDHYLPNRGKGWAVRRGMLAAEADWILFSDADLAAPIEEIEKLWPRVGEGRPIAIGSRPLRDSRLVVRQPWYREAAGRAFNGAVQIFGVRGIQDTQCGFKLFAADAAREIFSRVKTDGFGFDFESLMIARDLGLPIEEVPIVWSHQDGSKVDMVRDGSRMLRDLIRLRLAGRRMRLEPRGED